MGLNSTQRRVQEGTTPIYSARLRDENDDPILLADLSTITLTYYDVASGAILNSREAQNIKNANNVEINATSGVLTWQLQPGDTTIYGSVEHGDVEPHIALFEWTLANGRRGKHELQLDILNLEKVG